MHRVCNLFVLGALLFSFLACSNDTENAYTTKSESALNAQIEKNSRNSAKIAKYKKPLHIQESENLDIDELVNGNTDLSFDLYRQLCEGNGNLFFSPFSISSGFAMLYAGAINKTARQIHETMHFTLPSERLHPVFKSLNVELNRCGTDDSDDAKDSKFRLLNVNSIWGSMGSPITKRYSNILADNYGVEPRSLDFSNAPEQSRCIINDWITDSTGGLINNIVPPGAITSETAFVLANTIYFESEWSVPFFSVETEEGVFTLLDGKNITVPMMLKKKVHLQFNWSKKPE